MNDPLRSRGFRTQRSESPEDLFQPLYDRSNYPAAGTNSVSFFSTPKGGSATLITAGAAAAKNKTLRDTNIENANVVPAKMFKILGISLGIVHLDNTASTNVNDRALLRDGGYLEWKIVDKTILNIPLIMLPEVNPITAVGVATTVAATTPTISSASVGGGVVPMYKFPIPITLQPYENFTISCNYDGVVALSNTLDIYLILHSFMRRPT